MFPAWAILLYGATVLGLLAVIGTFVWRELRVWLIPESEIEAAALLLLGQYGRQANTIALYREVDAGRRHDHLEEGKWRRVRSFLRQQEMKG
jgi:hypothetical protein